MCSKNIRRMEEDILEIVRKEEQLQLEKYGKGKRKGSKLEASETKKRRRKLVATLMRLSRR